MTLKNIIPWIIALVLAALLLLATCNRRSDTTTPPVVDRQAILDSIDATYQPKLEASTRRGDSLEALTDHKDFEKELLSDELVKVGRNTNYLSNIIRALKKDSPITIYEQSCDSLAVIAPLYARLVDSFMKATSASDALREEQLAEWKQSVDDCDIAYKSAVDAAVKEIEAFSTYRKETAPRASLYIGITGGTNFTQSSAGPSLMYRGKGGRTQIMGAYEVGNTQPVYRAGIYKRINLKRK